MSIAWKYGENLGYTIPKCKSCIKLIYVVFYSLVEYSKKLTMICEEETLKAHSTGKLITFHLAQN